MTEKELLQELYEETMDVVFKTSGNYLMTISRKGLEKEWGRAKERAALLERMLEKATA